MRLLLIVQDPKFCALIRHHVSCRWPEAELALQPPRDGALLPREFLAQGYDTVLIDQRWLGGAGLDWLRDLAARPGFAPLVFLAESVDDEVAHRARVFGAFAVLPRQGFPHQALLEVLAEAARVQRLQLANWRVSPEAEASRRFGAVRIPGYRCVRRLAGGSLSQLYLAESEKAGSLLVIKVTPSVRDEEGVDRAFERFLQEYDIAHRLHHSSIVRCHELGVADDHAYLAMEYFPEGDLRRRLRAGVVPADALDLAAQIAGALAALHEAGALHRDLKPGNVLMRSTGRIALTDFGLAKHAALDLEITDPGIIFGTPHYMSPEQGHGEPVDERSDLYSLGVILFEMFCGEKPFTDSNPMAIIYKHRNQPVPRLPPAAAEWQELVDTLLAKRREDRYSTAAQAEAVLREAAERARGGGLMLAAATPDSWLQAAARDWRTLLVDHANCEKKAASTALALLFAYPEDRRLGVALARLAREELRHFEQVQKLMARLGVEPRRLGPGRYAGGLRAQLASSEPRRKVDLMLCGALIEARSCERFERLAPHLAEPLAGFYADLAVAERRHQELYVTLAHEAARAGGEQEPAAVARRLAELALVEARLATEPDTEFRFHSGAPAGVAAA